MKKLKLLMSVSLLCLSIAILCVGVFAITNVTYQIGGSISYEVEDVYCKITTKVYKAEVQRTAEQLQEDVNSLSATSLDKITYTLSQDMGAYDSYLKQGTAGATGININFGKETSSGNYYYTYYIVVNIENLSSATNMYAMLESNTNFAGQNVIEVTKLYQDNLERLDVKRNIVIALSIKDIKQQTTLDFSYDISVKNGKLPTGYTRLNYIQATGTQYIDTEYVTESGMVAEYKANWQTASGCVVGSHNESYPYGRNNGYLYSVDDDGNVKFELAQGEFVAQYNVGKGGLNQDYEVKFSTLKGNDYLDVNNVRIVSRDDAHNTSNTNLCLFTNHYNLKLYGRADVNAKLYYARIFSPEGKLVRNFIPCKNASGEIGMYDLMNSKF